MIVETEITKRLLIYGVVAVSVFPRQHVDRTRLSIGGDLSYPFRKLLLAIAGVNFVRFLLKESHIKVHVRIITDVLGIVQQLGYTFLCFLTPYILQKWLAPLVNLGGRPGQNLMTPLYASTLLSILSLVMVRTTHPNFWCLRKLGNVVSSPPVLNTLKTFNAVTTRGGHIDGRGTIMSQTLMVIEYWFILTQVLCAIGFALDDHQKDPTTEYNQWDHFLAAFREIAFVSDWVRICVHALFINQLDELILTTSPMASASSSSGGGGEDTFSPTNEEAEPEETGHELSSFLPRETIHVPTTITEAGGGGGQVVVSRR